MAGRVKQRSPREVLGVVAGADLVVSEVLSGGEDIQDLERELSLREPRG